MAATKSIVSVKGIPVADSDVKKWSLRFKVKGYSDRLELVNSQGKLRKFGNLKRLAIFLEEFGIDKIQMIL